jgi:hypothetical protein
VASPTGKTVAALAVSAVLVAVAAVLTVAAVLQPSTFGFDDSTRATSAFAASPGTAEVPPDAGASGGVGPAAGPTDPRATEDGPTSAPPATGAPSSPSTAEARSEPAPAVLPSAPPSPTTSIAPTRPTPPSGCREPEWDAERGAWHCSDDEDDEVEDD